MLEHGPPGQAVVRASLRVAGATIAQHQLGLARSLGCQQIVFMAQGASPEVTALQHDAQAAGMKIHIIADARELSALVTARDEVLVLSEGLLADADAVATQLDDRPSVLLQPAESAVEAGFERIDLNYASAGVALVPGRLVEKLHELPPDCDVGSALTRIALQHGVRRHEVPEVERAGARWRLVASETEAQRFEHEWLRHALIETRFRSPGFLLAKFAGATLGPALLHSGGGGKVTVVPVLVLLAIALGAGWTGTGLVAFLACALAALVVELHRMLSKLGRKISRSPLPALNSTDALGWTFDLVLVVLVAWQTDSAPSDPVIGRAFGAIVLVLLLRIMPRSFPDMLAGWLQDRIALALVLAIAAAAGLIPAAIQALVIFLLCWCLASLSRRGV